MEQGIIAKKEKAVIYARVSSAEQEKNGFSIPAQLDLLEKYANDKGFDVVEKFTEAETAKTSGRTEFNKMIKFLKRNKDVKTILAEKTDRLYRNFYDYITLDATKTGYSIHLVKENVILTPN